MSELKHTSMTPLDIVDRLRAASKAREIPSGISLGAIPQEWPGVLEIEAATEIERLRRIEAAARVQWEAFGAYPGLVEVLK